MFEKPPPVLQYPGLETTSPEVMVEPASMVEPTEVMYGQEADSSTWKVVQVPEPTPESPAEKSTEVPSRPIFMNLFGEMLVSYDGDGRV